VSGGAVLADAATLSAACVGAGIHLDFEVVVLAATVGTMASWIPLLPGGLGLVEAVIPIILHRFGAPLADALAATVVYRAAGTLVPALAGAIAAAAMRVQPAANLSVPRVKAARSDATTWHIASRHGRCGSSPRSNS
jgi:uncharacterized protein (TIRG00374 family)